MFTLEVLECDHPYKADWLSQPVGRVVPAHWWLHAAENPEWVTVCRLHWWQLWRLLRIRPRRYWPTRLVCYRLQDQKETQT